ncbi:uncharacterized protein BJ171DRAFT_579638 [Polychytrium aggregatum]|uniref:uncharacterized protein n=1 Tax=Polychytrium aggregatum TaxID=110093 RepID=UPI0022FE506B|nr:uncharacterized protein BJ171DRAFT_579638 [Polychytrium aggregatum]KAI9206664.1 hypothetical protein BJ171DRAFT_579638 [Polychytrium aggregatum]
MDTSSQTSSHTSSHTSSQTGRKIRYSGDLELRLDFDKDPLARPSNMFRNPDHNPDVWLKQAKRNSQILTLEEPLSSDPSNPFGDSNTVHLTPPTYPPAAAQSTFNGVSDEVRRSLRHGYAEGKLHPAGPRAFTPQTNGLSSEYEGSLYNSKGFEEPIYRQLRGVLYTVCSLSSLLALVLMTLVGLQARISTELSADESERSLISLNFFVMVGVFTTLLAGFYVVWYKVQSPSLNRSHYCFIISDNTYARFSDLGMHFLLLIFWISSLATIGTSIGRCTGSTRSSTSIVPSGSCATTFSAMAFASLSSALLLFGIGKRFYELWKSGDLQRMLRK